MATLSSNNYVKQNGVFSDELEPELASEKESSLQFWANSIYGQQRANLTGSFYDGLQDKVPSTEWPPIEMLKPPPWWAPILIIVGLVVIILIVVAVAIYCGLRGTLSERPTTQKKKFDPSDDSSAKMDMRLDSRTTCTSSRAGCVDVSSVNESTELHTLLVVPNNLQGDLQREPRRLNFHLLDVYEPPKAVTLMPVRSSSPVVKGASNSAADTQTEDDEEESMSCSL